MNVDSVLDKFSDNKKLELDDLSDSEKVEMLDRFKRIAVEEGLREAKRERGRTGKHKLQKASPFTKSKKKNRKKNKK